MCFTSPLPPSLPLLMQPYLHSVHNSPVKCQVVYSDVRSDIWQLVEKAGSLQNSVTHPARVKVHTRQMHILACTNPCHLAPGSLSRSGPLMEATWRRTPLATGETSSSQDMRTEPSSSGTSHTVSVHQLLTHSRSSTHPTLFCPAPTVYQRLLYTLRTAPYFQLEQERPESADRSLLNSRNIGFWDPRGDDERLMVTSICLEGWSLVVGFHGGQALVFKLNNQKAKHLIKVSAVWGGCGRVEGKNTQPPLTPVPSRSYSPFV